jgi:CyaY protein
MTTESEFIVLCDRVLDALGAAIDRTAADVDWALNDGVLTVECEDGSKLIVNRHVPNRELWVAAKAGGFHFRLEAGAWRDTRSGDELGAALARLFRAQAGVALDLPPLPG